MTVRGKRRWGGRRMAELEEEVDRMASWKEGGREREAEMDGKEVRMQACQQNILDSKKPDGGDERAHQRLLLFAEVEQRLVQNRLFSEHNQSLPPYFCRSPGAS